jgi:hypothetical protein
MDFAETFTFPAPLMSDPSLHCHRTPKSMGLTSRVCPYCYNTGYSSPGTRCSYCRGERDESKAFTPRAQLGVNRPGGPGEETAQSFWRFRVFSGYAQTRTGSRCSVPAVPRELIPSSRRGFQSGPEQSRPRWARRSEALTARTALGQFREKE